MLRRNPLQRNPLQRNPTLEVSMPMSSMEDLTMGTHSKKWQRHSASLEQSIPSPSDIEFGQVEVSHLQDTPVWHLSHGADQRKARTPTVGRPSGRVSRVPPPRRTELQAPIDLSPSVVHDSITEGPTGIGSNESTGTSVGHSDLARRTFVTRHEVLTTNLPPAIPPPAPSAPPTPSLFTPDDRRDTGLVSSRDGVAEAVTTMHHPLILKAFDARTDGPPPPMKHWKVTTSQRGNSVLYELETETSLLYPPSDIQAKKGDLFLNKVKTGASVELRVWLMDSAWRPVPRGHLSLNAR
ncbi:hypothetical protein FA13DRAFT_1714415 [Coprinellus micaceus]|uniref:Uncharacterized protein n=1 Tax=Coprinellus micaceus TaxID=71717 RepID=A0A4Y7SSB3_COPMI|nr:hypothetical protein FA13DRAFT_1714415 [Coprinellus micaceus]